MFEVAILPYLFSDGGEITSSWALATVNEAEKNGLRPSLLAGMDLSTPMTRTEFAAVAVELYHVMSGKPVPYFYERNYHFKDLTTETMDENYQKPDGYKEIRQAYNLGIVNGSSETTFNPNGIVDREQAATMLARVYTILGGKVPAAGTIGFTDDSSVSSWAKDSVAFMKSKDIINGIGDGSFNPHGPVTGEQALKMALGMFQTLK